MIISHKYKFIFLKTSKTAGTSIEIALSKYMGSKDIITPISPEDEQIRQKLGYQGPINYAAPLSVYGIEDLFLLLLKKRRRRGFYNHIPASEVRYLIGQKIWDHYFKFCFERNPWDRVVSQYYWKNQTEPRQPFSQFVQSDTLLLLKRRGFNLYTINGRVAVDRICHFENLAEELEEIRTKLGIPEKLNLPHAKARFRKDKENYRDFYGEVEKARISELFSDEIKLLGYEF